MCPDGKNGFNKQLFRWKYFKFAKLSESDVTYVWLIGLIMFVHFTLANSGDPLRSALISICRLVMQSLSNNTWGTQCNFCPGFNIRTARPLFSAVATCTMKQLKFEIYIILCRYSYHTYLSFEILKIKVNLVKLTFSDCDFLSSSYWR